MLLHVSKREMRLTNGGKLHGVDVPEQRCFYALGCQSEFLTVGQHDVIKINVILDLAWVLNVDELNLRHLARWVGI